MPGAVSETGDGVVAAKDEVGAGRIADRPAAFVLGDFSERAGMRAIDRRIQRRVAAIGRLRESKPQQPALRGSPRLPGARRARSHRRSRGPLGR